MSDLMTNLQSALATLLGCGVYPVSVPAGTQLPAASLNLISHPNESSHSGDSHLARARVQVQIFSTNYGEAFGLAMTIKQQLHAKRTPVTGTLNVFVEGPTSNGKDPDSRIYAFLTDLLIWYQTP